ncbi:HD domain-containing protein [Pseudomonas sp. gcc21]|uniref:HD domain-containing protein n=1 Tax=Pseudomonas sp. gcc21 TaxID=2726989 RepID=UPI0014512FB8|nr:HD domain-containing protein [Pseudomonas sp. gcc21]QJD59950.1 HD domain-containing protein [Pseudomonas sp. gcc21]
MLLELQDHPGKWPVGDLIAVSILVNRHGDYLFGSDGQIITADGFQSLAHLPASLVGSVENVMALEQWLQPCPYPSLKAFVYQVLGQPSIGCKFFSLPASRDHHHSHTGGLAQHSLEVARSVYAVSSSFAEHERWLAAVAGLLHDLGKVCCFSADGRRTETGYLISHELLGMELIVPALTRLDRVWADGANALRYLFDWMIRPRQQRPMMPIALTIKQADVMSASANNRQQAFGGKPDWHSFARFEGAGPGCTYWLPGPP